MKINGKLAKSPDQWVDLELDRVTLEGKTVSLRDKSNLYILLYKPKGYITTFKDPEGRPTVYDLTKDVGEWLVPVGRLDQDTSGLLLMTNETQFAERMTNPDYKVPKTYLIKASTRLSDEQLDKLRAGVELNDGPTRLAVVNRVRDSGKYTHFEMTITEGRNRQVRRMVDAIESKVLKLVRVSIGPLTIGTLEIGKWRNVTPRELQALALSH